MDAIADQLVLGRYLAYRGKCLGAVGGTACAEKVMRHLGPGGQQKDAKGNQKGAKKGTQSEPNGDLIVDKSTWARCRFRERKNEVQLVLLLCLWRHLADFGSHFGA